MFIRLLTIQISVESIHNTIYRTHTGNTPYRSAVRCCEQEHMGKHASQLLCFARLHNATLFQLDMNLKPQAAWASRRSATRPRMLFSWPKILIVV